MFVFVSEPLQEKSLSQGDVSLLSDNTPKKTLAEQVDSKMSLNETGWSTMSDVRIFVLFRIHLEGVHPVSTRRRFDVIRHRLDVNNVA